MTLKISDYFFEKTIEKILICHRKACLLTIYSSIVSKVIQSPEISPDKTKIMYIIVKEGPSEPSMSPPNFVFTDIQAWLQIKWNLLKLLQELDIKNNGRFPLDQNSAVNFRKFSRTNETEFSRVENEPHKFVPLMVFNDFEVNCKYRRKQTTHKSTL